MPEESQAMDGEAKASASQGRQILETYLEELRGIRASGAGVAETSYYPALSNLFNAVGKNLKPRVRCIIHTRNQGAGIPDGGLFTAEQFGRATDGEPRPGQKPARGVIEAKGTRTDIEAIRSLPQIRDYLAAYGIVLITNLREFQILERGPGGVAVAREGFALAGGENEFWRECAAHPKAAAAALGGRFFEFIARACLHAAPLNNPRDVAWFLASYARDALYRVESRKELPALLSVRTALEESLGMRFTGEDGEHFFRSTLVQTLFYGVFSAWVRWHKDNPKPDAVFNWQMAEWSLHVPFIKTLYEEVAKPSRLGPLGLVETLDWAAGVLNRVDRSEFFKSFEDEHAVQYFYEPFLEAYDPVLRKALGVWYTPPEIVKYQVARVDTVLREELDLPDGLADPRVMVLDPCCGTGAYLVEVLRTIADSLREKHNDALIGHDVKLAATTRVFGFEIMPAPFVISHLQIGSLLQGFGMPLAHDRQERAGVYLTNALTGWEPPKGVKAQLTLPYPELQEERDASEQVKREKKILVVLGNPPYNAFAGVSPEEEQGLVEPYKVGLNKPVKDGGWGIKKFNLDDLYVRFFRLAERRIAEMSGRGVVSFISNFSYLSDPSFVVMRQRFIAEFDKLWFDSMNGDSRETGKLTPDGKPDPSVFSTEYNRAGIRVGTAVCVMVRKPSRSRKPIVQFRQFWGSDKRAALLASLQTRKSGAGYAKADPRAENRLSFQPENVADHYARWPKLTDLCAVHPFNGPVERRAGALIAMDKGPLKARMRAYFDASVPDSEIGGMYSSLMMTGNRIVGPKARAKLLAEHKFSELAIVSYPFKPLDRRWAYLANVRPLFSEPSPHLLKQRFDGNVFLISRDTADKTPEGPPFFFSSLVCDYDCISGHARHFPVLLMNGDRLEKSAEATLFEALGEKPQPDEPVANLSASAREYLERLTVRNPDRRQPAGLLWMHALAIGYSPAYLRENADGIRRDWPRIPLPKEKKSLETSAALGEKIAALLDAESGVPNVTAGKIFPLLRAIGAPSSVGGKPLGDGRADLAVSAGWGIFQPKAGAVMPGTGRVTKRDFDESESAALAAEAHARGISEKEIRRLLGEKTLDVYLNANAYWANIPAAVWDYHIGGYQVIKKWLSYREHSILGRPLSPEEVREVTSITRRIAAIILLQPQLDENYRQIKSATFDWASVAP